ncbi:MAG TPA: lipase family protein [Phycisphaerae bacterium]|nr:lipase family protein [Phycisphaerae bacterium]
MPLNTQAPGFDIGNSLYLMQASAAAYGSDPAAIAATLGLPAPVVAVSDFKANGVWCFVSVTDSFVLLAFRGTDNLPGWMTDGNAIQVSRPQYPGKVHQGFADGLDSVWADIDRALPKPLGARSLWITGHSLGGALATLAAARLSQSGTMAKAVYTYGSPRVGNIAFFQGYATPTYRFVNNMDVVPHVPPEVTLKGLGVLDTFFSQITYKHVGTLEFLDRDGLSGQAEADWDATKGEVFKALMFKGSPLPEMVSDHLSASYISAIQGVQNKVAV